MWKSEFNKRQVSPVDIRWRLMNRDEKGVIYHPRRNPSANILHPFPGFVQRTVFRSNFLSSAQDVERLTRHFDTRYITPISFIYLYYVYSICVSKLVDPGRFPFVSGARPYITTTSFIKLIFFKKSHLHYLERLLSLASRKSARGENEKFIWHSRLRWI